VKARIFCAQRDRAQIPFGREGHSVGLATSVARSPEPVPALGYDRQPFSSPIRPRDGGMTVSPWSRECAHESSLHNGPRPVARRTEGKAQAHATRSGGTFSGPAPTASTSALSRGRLTTERAQLSQKK